MATYVMSDLHGDFERLRKMLTEIRFSENDSLYVLGDVIDRGENGIEIIRYIMDTPNIHMLLGNHEHMMVQFYKPDTPVSNIRRWNRNGNFHTLAGLDKLSPLEKQNLLDFVSALPVRADITVNGKIFVLIHGFTGDTPENLVWNRPGLDDLPSLNDGETLIIGHTPVCEYVCPGTDEDMYVYSHELTQKGDHFRILHAKGFTDIDCCLGYGLSAARLACLRLDDFAEFYV